MKLIIGLGNPGKKYELTRHNIGFLTVDYLSDMLDIPLQQNKFKGEYGEGIVSSQKIGLLKPTTFMNLSGESLQEAIKFYKINVQDILVIYDDLDLPLGKIKLRMKGGSGGHNGIKSIISHLGTSEFNRIRLGIGRPTQGDVVSYVLSSFSQDEHQELEDSIVKAAKASRTFLEEEDFSRVMNIYNV